MGQLLPLGREPQLNRLDPQFIPVAKPHVGDLEKMAVHECLHRGQLAGGAAVEEFESRFAAAHGLRFGVACNSGTTALVLALRGLDVRAGDRVLIPSLTMVAVANAVLDVGAIPLFADSEPDTGNPDESWFDVHSDYQAAIVPHLYGVTARKACKAAWEFNVKLIEDCAESHFGDDVGSFGDVAAFSFYGNKIIATGEGGMVISNEREPIEKIRSLRAHAFTPDYHFAHSDHAYGYRMTELSGAVGLAQLSQANEFLTARTQIAEWYFHGLRRVNWLEFPHRPDGSVWWVFPLLVSKDSVVSRDDTRLKLAEKNIETRTYFYPLHRQAHLRRYATHDMPVADDLFSRGFYLPMWVGMTREQVEYICDSIRAIS